MTEVDAYEHGDAYVFRADVESSSAHEITFRCFAVEREAPPEEWPLLAGEAIQNLRSSLDHVVYAASGGEDRTQFPIFTDTGKFNEKAPGMLQGVPESVRATIEKAQPYHDFPPAPAQAMLEQLRVLSNLDKHRTLTTIASAVVREGVGTLEDVTITWHKYATERPLGSGETHIPTFTASSGAGVGELDVEPLFGYEVRIERRPLNVFKGILHDNDPIMVQSREGTPQ